LIIFLRVNLYNKIFSFEKPNGFVPFHAFPAPAIASALHSKKKIVMRRSKYGYLLLALLVITGLAGTVTSTSLTSKERKFAANQLKDTRGNLMKSVKDLSAAQFDFKAAPDKWSIKECAVHIAVSEKRFWEALNAAMKQPANPEKRFEIKLTDEQVVLLVEEGSKRFGSGESLHLKDAQFKNVKDALETFKALRNEHIKYIKTTTEDLRNHVIQLPVGWIDCYQLCLLMAAYSNRHRERIENIKMDANFPSQ